MNFLLCIAKLVLMVVNTIFIILGFFILVIGSVLLFDIGGKILLLQLTERYSTGAALMFFGYYIVLGSLFGCIAALSENQECLILYCFAMSLLATVDFVVGIWALSKSNTYFYHRTTSTSTRRPGTNGTDTAPDLANPDFISKLIEEIFHSKHFRTDYDALHQVGELAMSFWALQVVGVLAMICIFCLQYKQDFYEVDEMYELR